MGHIKATSEDVYVICSLLDISPELFVSEGDDMLLDPELLLELSDG
jgi:hypothetical protein